MLISTAGLLEYLRLNILRILEETSFFILWVITLLSNFVQGHHVTII